MAYTLTVRRSPNGSSDWTTIGTWTSNGGPFFDMITDAPGAGTWHYDFQIDSNDTADVCGVRRVVAFAGNR